MRAVKFAPFTDDPPHIFHNRADGLGFLVRVKNVGGAAGRGRGVLKVLGDRELKPTKFEFDVPRLKPGRAKVIDVDVFDDDVAGINDYGSKACARARRDARPGNNCHKGPRFADIPQSWVGTTNSTVDDLGEVETCGASVTFIYSDMRSGAGKYFYSGGGSLSCTASGGNGGCTFAGSGDTAIEQLLTSLSVEARLTGYNAVGASSKSYQGTETCPPDPPSPYTFFYSAWLVTANRSMLSTDTQLKGTLPLGGDSYSWNLTAD